MSKDSLEYSYIKSIIEHVAIDNKLINWRIAEAKFETIGQNYFGVILPVLLSGKINGKDVELNLVLKLAPTDPIWRVSGAITLMFSMEVFVYSTLFSAYRDIQHHFNISDQFVIPKCYYLRDEYCKEVIVMENMCFNGYKAFDSDDFLNLDHVKLSIKSLAKFHALSFILKNRDLKTYEQVVKKCAPLTEKSNKRYFEILKDRLKTAIDKFSGTEYSTIFEDLLNNIVNYVESTFTAVNHTVICHGDIWKENILFKYEDTTPVAVCLIDYQVTRLSSPAYDVLYLITSSTDSSLRKENYYALLKIYYETFKRILAETGLDAAGIYSRENLDNDLKVVAPACLVTANTAIWLYNGLQQEGHVRSKKIITTVEENNKCTENYKNIVKNIVDDYKSYGYLTLDIEMSDSKLM